MRGKRRLLVRWTTVVAAALRCTGRPLRWSLGGRALVLGGVASGLTSSWETPRDPLAGLPALPRGKEPPARPEVPAIRRDTLDGVEDATLPPKVSQTQESPRGGTGEDR